MIEFTHATNVGTPNVFGAPVVGAALGITIPEEQLQERPEMDLPVRKHYL